jgi:Coenzyme PQQ synthesis protein D (PqqD)
MTELASKATRTATSYMVSSERLLSDEIDGEAIVINIYDGCYYSLNRSATVLWNALLEGPKNAEQLADLFDRTVDGLTVSEGVKAFLREVESYEIVTSGSGDVVGSEVKFQRELVTFTVPKIERHTNGVNALYTDM